MEEFKYKVYVKIDSNNCIIGIDSDLTLNDTTGYIEIDEGTGDKYSHAQGNYFNIDGKKPLIDSNGKYNYKFVDGNLAELTDEEKESLFPTTAPTPTLEEKNRADIDYIMIMQGL